MRLVGGSPAAHILAHHQAGAGITGQLSRNAGFVYNGDGQLVARRANGTTIAHYAAGGSFEKDPSTGAYKKYYHLGGKLVAEREVPSGGTSATVGTLHYLHQDHLGSTSLQTTANGQYEGHQLRGPFGQPWASGGSLSTDLQYTGQRSYEGGAAPLGSLLDYGARSYSPVLGKFLQADTMVPGVGRPQSWNRYSYTRNNPLKFVDPTGHMESCGDDCVPDQPEDPPASEPESPPTEPEQECGCKVVEQAIQGAADWWTEHFHPGNVVEHVEQWVESWTTPDPYEAARAEAEQVIAKNEAAGALPPNDDRPPNDQEKAAVKQLESEGWERHYGENAKQMGQSILRIRGQAADFVGQRGINWVVAESKGADTGTAIEQIRNTMAYLVKNNPGIDVANVEARIYVDSARYGDLARGVGTYQVQEGTGLLFQYLGDSTPSPVMAFRQSQLIQIRVIPLGGPVI